MSVRRVLTGGRVNDAGRLPRYSVIALLCLAAVWVPILAYLSFAPPRFTSEVALILPGSGASNSISLSDIGQASSYANSAYSSSSLSPTVTYKRLLGSARVLDRAAAASGTDLGGFGEPRVKLVDQTGLVLIEMRGGSPEEAQSRASALTAAFLAELDSLRQDEIARREGASQAAIAEYEAAVSAIRSRITVLQRETGLTTLSHFHELVADKDRLASTLRAVETKLEKQRGEAASLETALAVDPALAASTLKLHADPELQALAEAMSAAAARLASARGEFGEKHPTLIAARDEYAGAAARLKRRASDLTGLASETLAANVDLSSTGERAPLLADLVRLTAENRGLAAERAVQAENLEAAEARVAQLMESAAALDDLERDYQVAEAVFASALARVDTAKADLYASYPLIQVLEPATLPDAPSSPRKKIAIAAGIAGTFCLVIALILAWMRKPIIGWMLRSVTHRSDIEAVA